jgi:hypothetical protein
VFSRASVLALAAIASIAAAALITSAASADARGSGFSRGSVHFGGFRSSSRHSGLRFHHRRHWHRHWHVRWHRPWIFGIGTTAIAAPPHGGMQPRQNQMQPPTSMPTK